MSHGRRRLLLAAYAATTFLAFPHPIGSGVLDLGAVAAWFGPALLALAVEDLEPRRAGRWGLAAGLVAHAAILHWIYLREFALGLEALQRFVNAEPLRRVHECVFGVLALESEPVDPRL